MPSAVEIVDPAAAEVYLGRLEVLVRGAALSKALRAAAAPVVQQAKARCPRSRVTGTRESWSRSLAAQRSGGKDLADTIGVVVRDYEQRKVAVIGPQHPAGALGHLVEYRRRKILWGVDSGAEVDGHPFLRPAVDETRDAQRSAFVATLAGETSGG